MTKQRKRDAEQRYIRVWPDLGLRWGISRASAYRFAGKILPVMPLGELRLVPLDAVERYEAEHTGFDEEER